MLISGSVDAIDEDIDLWASLTVLVNIAIEFWANEFAR